MSVPGSERSRVENGETQTGIYSRFHSPFHASRLITKSAINKPPLDPIKKERGLMENCVSLYLALRWRGGEGKRRTAGTAGARIPSQRTQGCSADGTPYGGAAQPRGRKRKRIGSQFLSFNPSKKERKSDFRDKFAPWGGNAKLSGSANSAAAV